jgi:hypothetical protein
MATHFEQIRMGNWVASHAFWPKPVSFLTPPPPQMPKMPFSFLVSYDHERINVLVQVYNNPINPTSALAREFLVRPLSE